MQIRITLTREELDVILAEHLRKNIPDLQEAKSGVAAETVVIVTVKEETKKD